MSVLETGKVVLGAPGIQQEIKGDFIVVASSVFFNPD